MRQKVKDKIIKTAQDLFDEHLNVQDNISIEKNPVSIAVFKVKSNIEKISAQKGCLYGSEKWAEQCEKLNKVLHDILNSKNELTKIISITSAKEIKKEYEEWLDKK